MQQKRVKLRLYIEGIRIPVISAVVSGGTNTPATAAIQILPDPAAMDFPPRTLIHLFFYDFGHPNEAQYEGLDLDEEHEAYKLLFWGDLVMVQRQQTPRVDNIVIQCTGVSSYWEQAKQYFKDGSALSSASAKRMAFLGTDVIQYDGESKSPASSVVRLLTTKPVSNPGLQGLLGGCVHLLEGIGGIYKGPGRFKGLNDFFSAAELRLRLSQNIWASTKDDTSTKMFKTNDFKKWIAQAIRSKGGMISFGDILKIVLGAIQHEVHSMPAPYFKRAEGKPLSADTEKKTPKSTDSKYFPRLSIGPYDVIHSGQARLSIINSIKQRIETLEEYIPALNPTRVVNLVGQAVSGFYMWEPTQKIAISVSVGMAYGVETTIQNYETQAGKVSKEHWKSGADLLNHAYLTDLSGMSMVEQSLRVLHGLELINPDVVSNIERYQIETITPTITPAIQKLEEALKLYKALIKYAGGSGKGNLNYDSLDRLVYQVITPELYFVAPPACNVIFPEQRTSFSYTRNFLQEITRLQITMHDKAQQAYSYDPFGSNKHVYYAPNVQEPESKRLLSDTKKGTRVLMPHEIYSGIIPSLQQLAGLNVYATNPDSSSGYLQRVANFVFFKNRFASRTINLTSAFNPYLATGFPAMVVDQAVPLSKEEFIMLGTPEGLEKMKGQRLDSINKSITAGKWDMDIIDSIRMPVHYFGQLRMVRHSLTASSAHTQVSLAFCRTHDEKMEFLGADDEVHKKVTSSGTEILGVADAGLDEFKFQQNPSEAAVNPVYDIHSLGVNEITSSTPIIPQRLHSGTSITAFGIRSLQDPLLNTNLDSHNESPREPPEGVKSGTGKWVRDTSTDPNTESPSLTIRQRASVLNEDGAERPATKAEYDAFVAAEGKDALRGWKYEKRWAKYESYKIQVPPELALFPVWFADIYKNENIGPDFYKECLGVGSIMDAYEIAMAPDSPIKLDFGGARSDIEHTLSDPGNSLKLNKDLTTESREALVTVDDIEHAANIITLLYSAAKEEGVDVDNFIRGFTHRPVASLPDMFGDPEAGIPWISPTGVDIPSSYTPGFHENAFSAKGDLLGLVPADPSAIVSGNTLSPDLEIDKRIDPRPERHIAVMRYFQRLLLHKATDTE